MKRRLFLALPLALVACGRRVPALPHLAGDAVVLAFGDSLTFGTGADGGGSYPAALERIIKRRVVNAGVPGETSDLGRARLPDLLDEQRPALLLLCHGGNDLLRQWKPEATQANLRAMVEAARSRQIPVVLIGVPKPKLLGLESAPLYAQLAEEMKLPFEGEVIPKVEGQASLKSDQIHPNTAGYRIIAEAIAKLLERAGAI